MVTEIAIVIAVFFLYLYSSNILDVEKLTYEQTVRYL